MAEEVRHILVASTFAESLAVTPPALCGVPLVEWAVPLVLCQSCEEAEALGAPQARLFPGRPGQCWHLREITGRLFCGATSEVYGFDIRSVTAAIPICKPCRIQYRELKAGVTHPSVK